MGSTERVSGKMTYGHKFPLPPQSSRDGMYERRAFLERWITPNEHLNISTLLLLLRLGANERRVAQGSTLTEGDRKLLLFPRFG